MSYPVLRSELNRVGRHRALRIWLARWRIARDRSHRKRASALTARDVIEGSPLPGASANLDFVPTQDLSPILVRDWLDAACIDAALDEDSDVLALLDGARVSIRVRPREGLILLWCAIACDPDLDADRTDILSAVNELNRSAMYLRAILDSDPDEASGIAYEHEHFAVDGVVTRRQLTKLVRTFRTDANAQHERLHVLLS